MAHDAEELPRTVTVEGQSDRGIAWLAREYRGTRRLKEFEEALEAQGSEELLQLGSDLAAAGEACGLTRRMITVILATRGYIKRREVFTGGVR